MSWKTSELAYCTNVHAGESINDINRNLDRFVGPVRVSAQFDEMGAGLWLSQKASHSLIDVKSRAPLKQALKSNNLVLRSLNGFPFGDFHQDVIKESVYLPDWSEESRLQYTISLAMILADCLGEEEQSGTISTLPLGFSTAWSDDKHQLSIENLLRLVTHLEDIEKNSGKHIRVCLEMEPACVLQRTEDITDFFIHGLRAHALNNSVNVESVNRYLGVCYDVCHQAVMFEDTNESLSAITAAGITIGKVQLSNAIAIQSDDRESIVSQLQSFTEPRYLHQTSVRRENGEIAFYSDLSEAIDSEESSGMQEWRIHYHVPLQLSEINNEGLETTQFANEAVFRFLSENPSLKPHLEIETYTWNVLPKDIRPSDDDSLVKGIEAEIAYVKSALIKYKLLELESND